MFQIAVFVDAGYLFAQGSTALTGQKQARSATFLQVSEALEVLTKFAKQCAPEARLLRIYWYDGVIQGRLSPGQEQLAGSPLCKLRLGLVNSAGEQKGVDSLIVTDLIELARNNAITDAVLLAGDEDLRIGVQIAQSFGVQVHLLGIKPARGSQSLELIREADTHCEWDGDILAQVMKIEAATPAAPVIVPEPQLSPSPDVENEVPDEVFENAIRDAFGEMSPMSQREVLDAFKANPSSVPSSLDRTMLPRAGQAIGRQLIDSEKRRLRALCHSFLRENLTTSNDG